MKKIFRKISFISLFCLFLMMSLCFSGCDNQNSNIEQLKTILDRGKIIVGVKYDSKPFGFIDQDQKLKGFDVDLSKEIAKRLLGSENAIEFKQVTASSRILSLNSGAVDMVAATMTINPKRAQVVDFSVPYYDAGMALMIPKSSNIKTIKDLNNKKVIIVLGTTGEKNVREQAPKAMIQGFRTYNDAFSALKSGRGDVIVTDDTIIAGLIADDANYKMLKDRYTVEPYGIAFRKDENTKTFQDAVNAIINQIKEDGTLEQIKRKWMK